MAITIGGLTWDGFLDQAKQSLPAFADAIEVEERHGSDGHGTRPIGKRGTLLVRRPFKDFTSAGAATTREEAADDMRGTTGDYIDEWATTHSNVLVQEVAGIQKFAIISGSNTHRVACDTSLIKVAT